MGGLGKYGNSASCSDLPAFRLCAGQNRQPVEVANVLLKQAKDSTYITGMLTDTQGCFPLTSHWENTCCILPLSAAKTSTFPLCCKETKTLAN